MRLSPLARRREATVVTVNFGDFEAISYYCNVKAIKASEFFKQ